MVNKYYNNMSQLHSMGCDVRITSKILDFNQQVFADTQKGGITGNAVHVLVVDVWM